MINSFIPEIYIPKRKDGLITFSIKSCTQNFRNSTLPIAYDLNQNQIFIRRLMSVVNPTINILNYKKEVINNTTWMN